MDPIRPKGTSMSRTRSIRFLTGAVVVALIAVAISACGSGGGSDTASTTTATPKTADGQAATIGVANSNLGKILVDAQGRTLYLFKKDSGTKSACFGACASAWPPLRDAGKPTVAGGANASMVATTKRSDGKPEVTYNGHPLYLFTGDAKPGDTNGQGVNAFGGGWFALSPAGDQVSGQGSSSGSSNGY
jgi:predicted lipoprotein with Yx(FWY)xxD motif